MKYDIIKTDNYLLVVDESEIKAGEFYLLIPELVVKMSRSGLPSMAREWKKIIAHLPLNGSPILEGVDLLPPLEEEDVEKLAKEFAHNSATTNYEEGINVGKYQGYIEGYNKAKEKYKYTEEDMRKAWNTAYLAMSIDEETYKPLFFEDFIQSLSQPKMPIGFECNKIIIPAFKDKFGNIRTEKKQLKTITTPEGHIQWVGTYIYE